jgi:hypothetical protein
MHHLANAHAHNAFKENQMKLPHYVAGVSLAMALAACSGVQNGATPMTLQNGNSGNSGGITHYSAPAQRQADVVSGGVIPIDPPVLPPTDPVPHDPVKPIKSNPAQ